MKNATLKEFTIRKTTTKPGCFEFNRIPDFGNFEFERFNMILKGFHFDDEEIEEEMLELNMGFSVPKNISNPLEYFINILNITYNASIVKDEKHFNFGNSSLKTELNDIEMPELIEFIQNVVPEKKTFGVDELSIIEDYKYLYYSTSKWIEVVLDNYDNIFFFDDFDDLISTLKSHL